MARVSFSSAAIAAAFVVLAGAANAYDDKSPAPFAGPPGGLPGGLKDGYEGEYAAPARSEGIQIFVGTPYEYNGYRPYYGPYMYGSPTRSASNGTYVGVGHGYGPDAACRRWAWVHLRPGKWLWGVIDKPNGEWRCAEW
jgi:hypothetical protein